MEHDSLLAYTYVLSIGTVSAVHTQVYANGCDCMEHGRLLAYAYILPMGCFGAFSPVVTPYRLSCCLSRAPQLGIAQMLELNGILACFFSGLFFSAGLNAKERTEELQLQECASDWLHTSCSYVSIFLESALFVGDCGPASWQSLLSFAGCCAAVVCVVQRAFMVEVCVLAAVDLPT
eukprot:scaffold149819_cov16-Tisochrysis_lutea.AAC.1